MTEHTILVAFVVEADTMKQAQELLMMELPRPAGMPRDRMHENEWLDCWWIAEDERYDGSDNDSAAFVGAYHMGDRRASWQRAVQYLRTHIRESIDIDNCSFDEVGDLIIADGGEIEQLMIELHEVVRESFQIKGQA